MKRKLIKEINNLPEPPTSMIELNSFKNDNIDSVKLMQVLEKDPLIVANILKISNSSFFGFRTKIDTLSRAVNLLGEKFVISVAIGSSITQNLNPNLIAYSSTIDDFLFVSSLASNVINVWIDEIDSELKNELLLPAFLQEIGKFIISTILEDSGKIYEFSEQLKESIDITSVEEFFVGYSCAKITASILKKWNFSDNIVLPIAYTSDTYNCPVDFRKKAQILEIVKILCDIRSPFSEDNIQKALEKVILYNFETNKFMNSIETIKSSILNNS